MTPEVAHRASDAVINEMSKKVNDMHTLAVGDGVIPGYSEVLRDHAKMIRHLQKTELIVLGTNGTPGLSEEMRNTKKWVRRINGVFTIILTAVIGWVKVIVSR